MKSKKKNKTQKTKIKLKKIKNDCPIYLENKNNSENKFCNEAYGSNNFFKNEKSLYEVKNEKQIYNEQSIYRINKNKFYFSFAKHKFYFNKEFDLTQDYLNLT